MCFVFVYRNLIEQNIWSSDSNYYIKELV
jgi:hypothetical protein